MDYNDFFLLSEKYKRNFKINSQQEIINFKILCNEDKTVIFDYGLNGQFNESQQICLQKNKTLTFSKKINNLFQLKYDNYFIIGLNFSNNKIYTVELNQLHHLISLDLSRNLLKYIYIQKLSNLQSLNLHSNQLQSINLLYNKELQFLDLSSNKLTNINLNYNKKLKNVDLSNNLFNELKISNLSIQRLVLRNNLLTKLDINKTKLKFLNVVNNKNLTTININQQLQTLVCSSDQNFQIINEHNSLKITSV